MNFSKQLPNNLTWLLPTDVDLIRLGDETDGGYLIPKILLDKSDSLLSMGLGENWSFDKDWKSKKPKSSIHLYDGTITIGVYAKAFPNGNEIPWNHKAPRDMVAEYKDFFCNTEGVRHYIENIGSGRGESNLKICLDRLEGSNTFIKMDIEGGEYSIIDEIVQNADRITGIAAEFHTVNSEHPKFKQAVEKLLSKFELVHLHPNITMPMGPSGLTEAVELTFIRKDLCKSKKKRYDIYHKLDWSNIVDMWDIEYWFEEPEKE